MSTGSRSHADPPNVIVVMVDDMGYAGLSHPVYGHSTVRTPELDRLASDGLCFSDFHSSGTVCSPTRAGLLTGRYQQRAGIEAVIHPHAGHPENLKGLRASEITFAERFQQNNYRTAIFGKWHLGYAAINPEFHPLNHGFDEFKGFLSGNIDYISHWGDHLQHDWWHNRSEVPEDGYATHLITRHALDFVDRNRDAPFCLYVAHGAPHSPFQRPQDPVQRGPGIQERHASRQEAVRQMIIAVDEGMGQLRAKLKQLGLEQNTIIFFLSDNGDDPRTGTGSPRFRGHKTSVYEGGHRVPAIVCWPRHIEAGRVTDAPAISIDIMPTILSLAGITPTDKKQPDGIDLSPLLLRGQTLPERTLYWGSMRNNGTRSEAMRTGPWKLVVHHPFASPGTYDNPQLELFQLDQDEGEKNDLSAQYPHRTANMWIQLENWIQQTRQSTTPQPGGWQQTPEGRRPSLTAGDLDRLTANPDYLEDLKSQLRAGRGEEILITVRHLLETSDRTVEEWRELHKLLAECGSGEDVLVVFFRSTRDPRLFTQLPPIARRHRVKPLIGVHNELAALMQNSDVEVRQAAIELAGIWQQKALTQRLQSIVENQRTTDAVRTAAARALAEFQVAPD